MATIVALMIRFLITLATMVDISLSNKSSSSSNSISCIESEKQALLIFKRDLIDPTNRLVSWAPDAEDCCRWDGVLCDNRTGHVLELHLGLPPFDDDLEIDSFVYERSKLVGKINPSLSKLKHLRYLDLSYNAFEGIVPYQLGNLSNLQTLNLGDIGRWTGQLYVENLQWLSDLSLLKHLNLRVVNLNQASNWLHVVNSLPALEELNLAGCRLSPVPKFSFPEANLSLLTILDLSSNDLGNGQLDFGWLSNLHSLAFLNLEQNNFDGSNSDFLRNLSTSLRHLDLSFNHFNSIPDWIYSLRSLEVLEFRFNQLQGEISNDIGNMTSLSELDLSYNNLQGKLPVSVGNLCNLRSISLPYLKLNQSVSRIFEILSTCSGHMLDTLQMSGCLLFGGLTNQLCHFKNLRALSLYNNSISGPIPTCLGQLEKLEHVDLQNNLLEGVVSEMHFANLTKLRYFVAPDNSLLMLKVHPNWIPPFQLKHLRIGSWHLGPSFPSWLRSQKHLETLDISNSKISDSIPPWFSRSSTHISQLNLSHNHIHGQFEFLPSNKSGILLDLSFNNFSGPLPLLPSNYYKIDLSSNNFSGSLFRPLCDQLNGTVATGVLILSRNFLSGELPDCWIKWSSLTALTLDGNRFTGRIPTSMGSLHGLKFLNLQRNNLHGEIPLSMNNCKELVSFNLGENQLDGNIPGWLGHSFPSLVILSLRSNRLFGNIPDGLCALTTLQILDLADNTLYGTIPRCIYNFTVMAQSNNGSKTPSNIEFWFIMPFYDEIASVIMKEQSLEYSSTLNLVRVVDLSSNNLSGDIPQEVTILQALQALNLSQNNFTGNIPGNIGAMQSLLSLDLSQNRLIGSIPPSMSSLTFLSFLDLSCNNLTGEIPSSTQLQTFSASSYTGNNLCGPPLKNCGKGVITPNTTGNEDNISHEKMFEVKGLYISIALGFIVGFWSIMVPLVISRRWRFTYYGFLEQMWWRLQDFVLIIKLALARRWRLRI